MTAKFIFTDIPKIVTVLNDKPIKKITLKEPTPPVSFIIE